MSNQRFLDRLLSLQDAASLESLLRDVALADVEGLRSDALDEFDALIDYSNAREWARIVVLCSVLGAIGWGKRERVHARAVFNGDCWETYLATPEGARRLTVGRWKMQKGGWTMFNPEYKYSADYPSRPERSWSQYVAFRSEPVPMDSLPRQDNTPPSLQFSVSLIGSSRSLRALQVALQNALQSHPWNTARALIREFYIQLVETGDAAPHLLPGRLDLRRASFSCKIILGAQFLPLNAKDQRKSVADCVVSAACIVDERIAKTAHAASNFSLGPDVRAACAAFVAATL